MTQHITPGAAREALRTVDAAPTPPRRAAALAVALSVCSFTPSFLGNVWMGRHGGVQLGWWAAGLCCTLVLVAASLVLVARLARVARGWRRAPLFGLGAAGICYAASTLVVTREHPAWWIVVGLGAGSVAVSFLVAHAFADAPDDLGLSAR